MMLTPVSIMVSDLRTLSPCNCYIKYADDVDLASPEKSDVDLVSEFDHLKDWATSNNLTINFAKTKEMVFHRPSPRLLILPPPLSSIQRVHLTKLDRKSVV